MFSLLAAVETAGATAVFEWVGRQAQIKVKEGETRLVTCSATGERQDNRSVLEL